MVTSPTKKEEEESRGCAIWFSRELKNEQLELKWYFLLRKEFLPLSKTLQWEFSHQTNVDLQMLVLRINFTYFALSVTEK